MTNKNLTPTQTADSLSASPNLRSGKPTANASGLSRKRRSASSKR
jgi:hypothetical protein